MTKVGPVAKIMGSISRKKPLRALGEAFQKDPEKALALTTVSSIILKDGVGCYMYVTQSLHNKKIPDEKRKFVAALDLTNGGLMILAQIAMFFAMRKYSGPLFNKLFKKSFNEISKSQTISRVRMNMAKRGEDVAKKLKIEKEYEKVKKSGQDIFKFILDISAATIIGKRVIVPLIATPLARGVEKRMNKHDAQKAQPEQSGLQTQKSNTQVPEMNYPKHNLDTGTTNLLAKYRK